MIGKRFAWDSNFTIKTLENAGVTKEQDPLVRFPFLALTGTRMEDVDKLEAPGCNSPRGYKEIFTTKQEPLENSLTEGWWCFSWFIPLLDSRYFDRRHTVKTIQKLIREKKIDAKYIPVADYERVHVDHEPLISSFTDESIMQMAGLRANVEKGNDDAQGDHFVNTIIEIIDREEKLNPEYSDELKSKDFIRRLLTYMGAFIRYNDRTGQVSTKIPNRIWNHYNTKVIPGAGQKSLHVEEADRNKFITDSDEWPNNAWNNQKEDDEYKYRVFAIDNIKDHHRLIVEKIDQLLYKIDNDSKEEDNEVKTLKVMLWCRQTTKFEAAHAPNIIASREGFKKYYQASFYNTRNSVTSKFQEAFPKHYDEYCKHPSDYNLEIHFMPQVDGEDEDKTIQWEDIDRPGEFDGIKETFDID